ncbi:MAG: NADH dehydrogenase [ubiquinone] 1 alpha subcomplex assembly factor 1 [Cryomorphaceae bacterium]|jgi:NADH dehydrogenase [ubiquinone] 1 alpha subcomplex assembly factor 1
MNIKKMQFLLVSSLILMPMAAANGQEPEKKITPMEKTDFKDETGKVKWRTVNDSVMGGRSQGSSFLTEAGNRIFSGEISLKNNGGFSSVRTFGAEYDLSAYEGVIVKVRGDGRKYYFTARANNRSRVAFWYDMQTKVGELTTFKIPFSSLYATSFGRKLASVKFNPKNITSFGLMLYDKKEGEFNLELESVKIYGNSSNQKQLKRQVK